MMERVYHEKQVAGLCAVHALNSLLQDAIFSPVDLMEIAREFDKIEREAMMAVGNDTPEFLRFMAEDSGNVADDGNYSVQVIQKALEVWNISCIPITNPDMAAIKENPLTEQAFICNLASHWLTIRKIGDHWWNFNSLLDEPQHLSEFYLSAFLDTLLGKGYSVFVVRGPLPPSRGGTGSNWVRVRLPARAQPQRSFDDDLNAAIAASLGNTVTSNISAEDSALEAAIAASMAESQKTGDAAPSNSLGDAVDTIDDDELAQAIQMSLVGKQS